MMPTNDDIGAIEVTNKRQRAEAHGARSECRWCLGSSVSHGLLTR